MIAIPVWAVWLIVTVILMFLFFRFAYSITSSGGSDYFGIGAGFAALISFAGIILFVAFWCGWLLRGCGK